MLASLACSKCGKTLRLPNGSEGKKIRCPACQHTFLVPKKPEDTAPSVEHAEPISADGPVPAPCQVSNAKSTFNAERIFQTIARTKDWIVQKGQQYSPRIRGWWQDEHVSFHTVVSWFWLLVGFNLLLLAPRVGLLPVWLSWPLDFLMVLPVYATMVLIAWNLRAAVAVVGRTGEILPAFPFTVLQFALFTLLFPQIAIHWDASHFRWSATPAFWNWIFFSLSHVLRAGDVVDFLEAYHLQIQTIKHASLTTGSAIVLFHLVMDFFFLGLFMKGVASVSKPREPDDQSDEKHLTSYQLVGGFVVIWLVLALFVRRWQWQDILLWPIDNLLKVTDIGDLMQVYDIRLHDLPDAFWENTLTFVCRFLIWYLIIDQLNAWKKILAIRYLHGFGLAREELEKLQANHPHDEVRVLAAERLKKLAALPPVEFERGFGLNSLAPGARRWFSLATVALLALAVPLWFWQGTIEQLARNGATPHDSRAYAAYYTLKRLGTYGESAVPILEEAASSLPRPQQYWVAWAMGSLGERALPYLESHAIGLDEELAIHCARALAFQGPRSAPALARGMVSPFSKVTAECKSNLTRFGRTSLQDLVDTLSPGNVGLHLPLIAEFDTYWYRASTSNTYFHEVVSEWNAEGDKVLAVRRLLRGPEYPKGVFQYQSLKAPTSALAVPALIALLDRDKGNSEQLIVQALRSKGGPAAASAAPRFVQILVQKADKVSVDYSGYASTLGGFGEVALPILHVLLKHPSEHVRAHAAGAVANCANLAHYHKQSPDFSTTVSLLEKILREDSGPSKFAALNAAFEIGPKATTLTPLLTTMRMDSRARNQVERVLSRINPQWQVSATADLAAALEKLPESERASRFHDLPEESKRKTSVEDLASMLRATTNPQTAVHLLNQLRKRGADASPALAAALEFAFRENKMDSVLYHHVKWVLEKAPLTPEAIKIFESNLTHTDEQKCNLALGLLWDLNVSKRSAFVDALTKAAKMHPRLEASILQQITNIQNAPETVMPLLLEKLADPGGVRFDASIALVKIGAKAVPGVIAKLTDARVGVRSMAILTLSEMGRAAEPALPALEQIAQSDTPELREAAERAMTQIRGVPKSKRTKRR